MSASSRSNPTRGTTPSCWTSRISTAPCAVSSPAVPSMRGFPDGRAGVMDGDAGQVRYVAKNMRLDLRLIAEMIAPGSRVLDIGCGDGSLIDHLSRTKGCGARGIGLA